MELKQNDMLQLLEGLQLEDKAKEACGKLWDAGEFTELHGYLRSIRRDFLDDLHQSQQRLDRLDYLIYSTKKKLEES